MRLVGHSPDHDVQRSGRNIEPQLHQPHPADGMVGRVDCGGGATMCLVVPGIEQTLDWSLRYATNVEPFRYSAAAVISSYDYLLSGDITMAEATRRLRLLRAARKGLANG